MEKERSVQERDRRVGQGNWALDSYAHIIIMTTIMERAKQGNRYAVNLIRLSFAHTQKEADAELSFSLLFLPYSVIVRCQCLFSCAAAGGVPFHIFVWDFLGLGATFKLLY
jgi:hypothetical protein